MPTSTTIFLAPSFVLDEGLTNTEKVVLMMLAAYSDTRGAIRVRHATLAKHYGCSERFIRRVLGELRAKGYIAWTQERYGNCYRLLRLSHGL